MFLIIKNIIEPTVKNCVLRNGTSAEGWYTEYTEHHANSIQTRYTEYTDQVYRVYRSGIQSIQTRYTEYTDSACMAARGPELAYTTFNMT